MSCCGTKLDAGLLVIILMVGLTMLVDYHSLWWLCVIGTNIWQIEAAWCYLTQLAAK